MQDRIGRMLDALTRVDELLSTVPEFAPLTGSTARASLTATIAELNAQVTVQDQAARESKGATQTQRKFMATLRRQMRTIATAARLRLREAPEFVKLEMPKGKPSVQQWLGASEGMLGAATTHRDTLVATGLRADFTDQLRAAIDGVRSAITARNTSNSVRTGATTALTTLSRDVNHVLTLLEGLVVSLIPAKDPDGLLARWKQARRIGRNNSVATPTSAPTQTSTPAPAVATSPSTPEATSNTA